jgi:filamentous hemagglutinin
MNRNFHRIIFNAARGLRMVVQETALSTGRGTSRATAGRGVALRLAAVVAMLASAPLQAQIAGDRNAPGAQRPVVLTAPNGVPLVNIQAPSAVGVSHNVYRQFDVGANGAILNNSRTNVQTQLGGFVAGNPMLAHGAARVIVNEVRSTDPSLLRGFIEVAGQRADVIVANPAGISVDGGGFINVHRATLTTGVPQFGIAGNLEAYVVRGGRIAVAGAGLDAGGTDSLAILTRAFELSGALHAGDLKVVTGANRIDADLAGIVPITGQAGAPAYAIDVARLGGMYAGHIALVVNEAGVGARNAGTIQTATGPYTVAGGGQLSLSASGRLENSGFIQAASDAAIDAAGVANGGVVQSAAGLRITTRDDLANHLATTAGTLEGARLELTSTAGDLDNRGGILRQTGGGALAIDAPHLSNAQGGVIGVPPAPAPVPSPAPAATGAPTGAPAPTSPPTGSGTATGSGAGAASGGAGGAASPAVPAPAPPAPGRIAAAAGRILNDGGTIHAGGDITLRTTDLDNAGGTLRLADLSVSGAGFSNAGGTLDVGRAFTARVATLDNAGGTLRAGALDIETTADLDNHGGTLASGGAAHLRVGGGLDNAHGTISAIDALDATVAGALDDTAGQLVANAALTVSAATLDNTRGTLQSAGDAAKVDVVGHVRDDQGRIGAATDLDLRAGSLANTGAIRAERDGRITVATRLDNGSEAGAGGNPTSASGTITSGRHTAITAGVLASDASGALGAGIGGDGKPGATGDLSVSTTGRLAAGGTMLAAGRLALRGADVDLSGAQVRGAEVALTAATGDVVTRHARVAASGSLSVAATGTDAATLVNSEGSLDAGRLDLHVANLRNTAGGRLVQTGADALDIAIAGTLDNAGGVIASNGAELALSAVQPMTAS